MTCPSWPSMPPNNAWAAVNHSICCGPLFAQAAAPSRNPSLAGKRNQRGQAQRHLDENPASQHQGRRHPGQQAAALTQVRGLSPAGKLQHELGPEVEGRGEIGLRGGVQQL